MKDQEARDGIYNLAKHLSDVECSRKQPDVYGYHTGYGEITIKQALDALFDYLGIYLTVERPSVEIVAKKKEKKVK
jgi:hypothetical protein